MTSPDGCPFCGFENPRSWRACARCGAVLGSAAGPTLVGTRPSATFTGRFEPAPAETDPGLELESALEAGSGRDTMVDEEAPEGEPPLVGQADAARALAEGIERAFRSAEPTLIALEGPRGSGKTRLLVHASELAAGLAPEVQVRYASCRDGDGPYGPFARLLLDRFAVTPASSLSSVRAHMSTEVADALQTPDPIAVGETTHLLGHLAGIPFPESPFLTPLQASPDELHRRACVALRRLLEADAARRPLLLLLDDAHCFESQAWELLAELGRGSGRYSLVITGAGIAARAGELEVRGGAAIRSVLPLAEAEVGSLLHVILPNLHSAPEPLVAALFHRSGGNPSAIRELAFALIEAGLLQEDEDGRLKVDLKRLESDPDLPVNMEDAIGARLSRLDEVERATLERASVIGETFWEGALLGQLRAEREPPGREAEPLSIWPDDEDAKALADAVDRLVAKGFAIVRERSTFPGTRELGFATAGTRERLYREMDPRVRIARHGAVARWFSVLAILQRERVMARIAPHLELAGEPERAGRAYLEAAAYERAQMQTHAALRHVEKALPLIPAEDAARRIDALHEHGSTLTTLGRYDEAIAAFTEMLRLAWRIGARGKGGAALNRIARAHRRRGDDERARRTFERALELFRSADDHRGVAATLDDLAQVETLFGNIDRALELANEALGIRRSYGDRRGEAVSLNTIGQAEIRRGQLEAAEARFRASLTIREEIGDQEGILQSHNALAIVAYERGDREGAVAAWRAALAQAQGIADRRNECFLLNNIGEALATSGQLEEARPCLLLARELAEQQGDRRSIAEIARNQAMLAMRESADDAEAATLEALQLAEQYGGLEAIALAQRCVGALRARTVFSGDAALDRRAEDSYLVSIDLFREAGNEREAARSLAELGHHLIERGDVEGARERLREARAVMRRMGLAELEKVESTLQQLA